MIAHRIFNKIRWNMHMKCIASLGRNIWTVWFSRKFAENGKFVTMRNTFFPCAIRVCAQRLHPGPQGRCKICALASLSAYTHTWTQRLKGQRTESVRLWLHISPNLKPCEFVRREQPDIENHNQQLHQRKKSVLTPQLILQQKGISTSDVCGFLCL